MSYFKLLYIHIFMVKGNNTQTHSKGRCLLTFLCNDPLIYTPKHLVVDAPDNGQRVPRIMRKKAIKA